VQRVVEPEILDTLPPEDPAAVASRRDLRLINGLMGNHRWLERRVRTLRRPGWRMLELGAGDGTFGRRLVRKGVIQPGELLAVDLAPRPADWPSDAGWLQQNVLAGETPPAEVVIANLFLHHFEPGALRDLAMRLPAECEVMLCCEPARRALHLWQARLLSVLPIGRVTKHDMPISIRAGFVGRELPELLGIAHWKIEVSTGFFGAYRLEAHRP
jgi:hypothetical protein